MEMTGRLTRQPVGVGVHVPLAQPLPRHVVRVGVDDGPGRPELRGVLHLNTRKGLEKELLPKLDEKQRHNGKKGLFFSMIYFSV